MPKIVEKVMNSKTRKGAALRWCSRVASGFLDNHCSMHAAGLTYFSLLAIVPILCILLLAAKSLNADEYVRKVINARIDAAITSIEAGQDDDLAAVTVQDEEQLEARKAVAQDLGREAREISDKIFERIEQFDVGTLGWIGFVMLLWTVISSIGMIEVSFNEIWCVPKVRPIWNRAWLYLAVVVVLPVCSMLAVSVPALNIAKNVIVSTLGATRLTGWVSQWIIVFLDSWVFRSVVTVFFSSASFAFMFYIMPNCRVCFKSAFKGGFITAVMFGAWLKICAVAQVGVAKSSALYGSFAFLPIVLAWLYMSWQIILLGANMVRAFEIPDTCGEGVETAA